MPGTPSPTAGQGHPGISSLAHPALGTLGAVPVWVSPATSYLADTTSTGTFQPASGAAFSRIDLTDDGPAVTVLPIPAGEPGK